MQLNAIGHTVENIEPDGYYFVMGIGIDNIGNSGSTTKKGKRLFEHANNPGVHFDIKRRLILCHC